MTVKKRNIALIVPGQMNLHESVYRPFKNTEGGYHLGTRLHTIRSFAEDFRNEIQWALAVLEDGGKNEELDRKNKELKNIFQSLIAAGVPHLCFVLIDPNEEQSMLEEFSEQEQEQVHIINEHNNTSAALRAQQWINAIED